ncbi:MAG: hypothetical protein K1X71_09210 [Pirellulales bacterium]|nr:hypothetical protein [Pirellulales bacterium]
MADDSTALAVSGFPALAEVCESPDDFLSKLDVGALNLMCACGLPGAEGLDIVKQLAWLDEAARQVDFQTRNNLDGLVRTPAVYNNSPGYFCCNYLLKTLQEVLGVRYNPARVTDSDFQNPLCINPDFSDSRDLFIHGMTDGPGGTCASMPVLYVAVGRRLGYPLSLVEAPGHLFFRWEGSRFNVVERFNVEGAGHGISFYPDDYYLSWPKEWRPSDKAGGWYLKSLSPAEELAAFLFTRGSCLEDNGRTREAVQAFEWASKLLPDDLRYSSQVVKLMRRELQEGFQALQAERQSLEMERMVIEQQQRRLVNDPFRANGPPHPDVCQCTQCRQSRLPARRTPGHMPGCPCPMCKTSPW